MSKLLHNIEDLADHLGVKGACGLVKEHHVRLHAKRADYGYTLLLTAGELAGIRIGALGKSDAAEKLHRLGLRLLLAFAEKLHRRKGHISQQRHVRKEVKVLEHHAHLLTVEIYIAARVGYIDAVKGYRAARGHLKKIEASQEGRFARAGGTDDNDDLALMDLGAHAVEGFDLAVPKMLLKIVYFYENISGHCCAASFPACLRAM